MRASFFCHKPLPLALLVTLASFCAAAHANDNAADTAGTEAATASPWRVLPQEIWDPPYPETFKADFPVLDIPNTDGEFRAIDPRLLEGRRNLYMRSDALAFLDEPAGIETPHTPWGRPLADGAVSILYITQPGRRNREIIELQQRLDSDIRTLFVPRRQLWERFPNTAEVVEKRQTAVIREGADVIVMNHSRDLFEVLEDAYWELIKEQVAAGTGLVLLYDDDPLPELASELEVLEIGSSARRDTVADSTVEDHPASRGIDMSQVHSPGRFARARARDGAEPLITRNDGDEWIMAKGEFGEGRIVGIAHLLGLRHVGMPEEHDRHYRYWEQVFSLHARAALWAAGRPLETQIDLAVDDEASPPIVSLTIDGPSDLLESAQAEVTVRDDEHQTEVRRTLEITAAEELSLALDELGRSGLKLVEVRLLDSGGSVLDWAAASFTVPSAAEASLTATPTTIDAGERVTFELEDWEAAGDAWRVRVHDAYGRLVAEQTTQEDTIAYQAEAPRGRMFRVTADVLEEHGSEAERATLRRRGHFTVPTYATDDYHNYFWPTPVPPYVQDTLYRLYQHVGVEGVYLPPWAGTEHAWYAAAGRGGIEIWGGNLGSVARQRPDEDGQLAYPPRSPQWYERYLEQRNVPEAKARVSKFGVGHISLQDEGHLREEASFDDWTLGQFREVLQERYGDLEALNAHWDSDFETWDEVRPSRTDDMDGAENFAPWLEFRAFMDSQMATALGEIAETFRELTGVADLPVGVEGIWGFSPHHVPYGLYDYAKMSEAGLNAISPYVHEIPQIPGGTHYDFDLIKGLGQDHMSVGWINAYNAPWMHTLIPWWGLFHGGHGTSYYSAASYISTMGAINPRAELVEAITRPLREGVGKLVIDSDRVVDPVGIYFDMSNFHLAWIIDQTRDERVWFQRLVADGKASIERMLQDLGVTPGWLTEAKIEAGALEQYRVVILTGALRLSDSTLDALRDYVDDGGVVIADGLTGMYDETGRPADLDRLVPLFGVTRTDREVRFQPPQYSLGLTRAQEADTFPALETEWLKAAVVETGLEADGSVPLGAHVQMAASPAFFAHEVGEGRTLYLNGMNTTYVNDADERDLNFWTGLLASCDIRPDVGVYSEGDVLDYYDVKQFRAGEALLAGVIRSPRFGAINPLEVDVRFPDSGVIYDVINSEIAGRGDAASIRIKPGQPALLASLPEQVTAVELSAPSTASVGEVVELDAEVLPRQDVDTVIRLVVRRPDGETEHALTGNFDAPAGQRSMKLPLSLDAQTGEWILEATDVISGLTDETVLEVR